MQTRLQSLVEGIANIIIGYWISVFAQKLIFPIFDIDISTASNLKIGLLFTVVSLVRSYVLRRLFNRFKGRIK